MVRAKNALLPVITAKDWADIDFAISEQVDFIAISFVKTSDVVKNLKSYINARSTHPIEVIAKIESLDSIPNMRDIIQVSDGIMVARGDLGAQVPIHDVPALQRDIVYQCRQMSKPVIIASHLLNSMIEFPTPTRAEVADISDLVRQRADAALLSSETAIGSFPDKSLDVSCSARRLCPFLPYVRSCTWIPMTSPHSFTFSNRPPIPSYYPFLSFAQTLRSVMTRIEEWVREEKFGKVELLPLTEGGADGRISDQLCRNAAEMANSLGATAIFVYTRRGYMARMLSRYRPDCPIFAFTPDQSVRRRLNMSWGVCPFRLEFSGDPEENVERSFRLMVTRGLVKPGDLVVLLSDLGLTRQGQQIQKEGAVRSIQVRRVAHPEGKEEKAEKAAQFSTAGTNGAGESLKDRLLRMEQEQDSAGQAGDAVAKS